MSLLINFDKENEVMEDRKLYLEYIFELCHVKKQQFGKIGGSLLSRRQTTSLTTALITNNIINDDED